MWALVEDKDLGRDWFILRLSQEGWSLQTVPLDDYRIVYLASRKDDASTQSQGGFCLLTHTRHEASICVTFRGLTSS
jgi:hypothetical protein